MFLLSCCHKHFQCFHAVYLLPTTFKSWNFLWSWLHRKLSHVLNSDKVFSLLLLFQRFESSRCSSKKFSLNPSLRNRKAASEAVISETPRMPLLCTRTNCRKVTCRHLISNHCTSISQQRKTLIRWNNAQYYENVIIKWMWTCKGGIKILII